MNAQQNAYNFIAARAGNYNSLPIMDAANTLIKGNGKRVAHNLTIGFEVTQRFWLHKYITVTAQDGGPLEDYAVLLLPTEVANENKQDVVPLCDFGWGWSLYFAPSWMDQHIGTLGAPIELLAVPHVAYYGDWVAGFVRVQDDEVWYFNESDMGHVRWMARVVGRTATHVVFDPHSVQLTEWQFLIGADNCPCMDENGCLNMATVEIDDLPHYDGRTPDYDPINKEWSVGGYQGPIIKSHKQIAIWDAPLSIWEGYARRDNLSGNYTFESIPWVKEKPSELDENFDNLIPF